MSHFNARSMVANAMSNRKYCYYSAFQEILKVCRFETLL